MRDLWSRLAVVAVGLPIVLAGAYYGGWWLFVLVVLAGLIALDELYRAGRSFRPLVLAGFAGLAGALAGAQLGGAGWMIVGVFVTLPLAFLFVLFAETRQAATVSLAFTVLGVVWIGIGLAYLILLRDIRDHGRLALFTLLLAVFATDTAAYVVGRVVGRRRMAPTLSPGKSWEGFLGGVVGGVFVTWIALYDTGLADGWRSLVLGATIVLASTLGDLVQSLFKRDVGIKDTGRLLGGHGGVFDRIDSLLIAGPTAYFVLAALGEFSL